MVVEALRQQACGGRQVYIMGKGGEHCTVRMGMTKKPEVREREVEASVVKRCPAGLPCSGAGGAGFFPVGEKRQPFCRRMARSSAERIQGYGWVEERTACKEKPHTAIRVRQNSFEKHFPKCP